DSAATCARLFKQLDHVLVAPISGNGEQLFAAVCRIEQNLRRIEVSFAHREVERLVVLGQLRIALKQAAKRPSVTINGGTDRVPHVTATAQPGPIRTVGFEFFQLDHGWWDSLSAGRQV